MTKQALSEAVRAAQRTRLDELGAPATADSQPLMTDCQQNSAALRDELQDRGIDCQVVGGALKNAYPPGDIPDTFATVKADGFGVHYWVESGDYICELASESEHAYSQPLVTELTPDDLGYVRFEDSYDITIPF